VTGRNDALITEIQKGLSSLRQHQSNWENMTDGDSVSLKTCLEIMNT